MPIYSSRVFPFFLASTIGTVIDYNEDDCVTTRVIKDRSTSKSEP